MSDSYPDYYSLAHPHFSMWTKNFAGYMIFNNLAFHKNPKNLYLVPGDYTNMMNHPRLFDGGLPSRSAVFKWYYAYNRTQLMTNYWCSDKFSIGWFRPVDNALQWWEIVPYTSSPAVDPLHPKVVKHLPPHLGGESLACESVTDPCCLKNTKNGPSNVLITPIWSSKFDSFLKKYMGKHDETKCPREHLKPKPELTHDCGVDPDTSNPPNIIVRNKSLVPACSPDTMECLSPDFDYCQGRSLDTPSETNFDRPMDASTTWIRMGGAHVGDFYRPWMFSRYEYRYINFGDPRPDYGKEYHLDESEYPSAPQCTDLDETDWMNIEYFHDGIQICWPKCGDGIEFPPCSPGPVPSPPTPSPWPGPGQMLFDTPICKYDKCWIGWEGGQYGSQAAIVPNKYGGTDKDYQDAIEDGDHSKACPPSPPKAGEHFFHTSDEISCGKLIPHQNWVPPNRRVFDYWAMLDGQWSHAGGGAPPTPEDCMNVNLEKTSLTDKQKKFFLPTNTLFHDPAFSKVHRKNEPEHDHKELLYPDCCPYGGD